MKFPVMDKESKRAFVVIFPLCIAIFIGTDIILAVKATFDTAITKIGIVGTMHLFTVIIIALTIYIFVYEYAAVTIDENGVTLTRGKLTLKHFEWGDVKRIEKMLARRGNVLILLTQYEPTKSFSRGNCMLEVVGRNHIMMLYSKKALNEISKYCNVPVNVCEI